MYYVIVIGPAGSGKSYLVDALSEWLRANEVDTIKVNLDPAAEWTPYQPDIDIRDYVNTREVMKEYKLGPNGALIFSIDMMINYIDDIRVEIEETRGNYVIVDTPGQMELFAFRETGPVVLRELIGENKSVVVFLIDVIFLTTPTNIASILTLAMSTRLRLQLPLVLAVSKADLLEPSQIDELDEKFANPESLYLSLTESKIDPNVAEAVAKTLEALLPPGVSLRSPIRFISSLSGYGIDDLYSAIQQVLAGGEDFLTEEPSPRR